MHERPSYSYRAGPDKLIHSVRTGRTQLYRIPEDPDETADLSAREPIRTEMLRQALYRWLRGLDRRRGSEVRGEALSPRDRGGPPGPRLPPGVSPKKGFRVRPDLR